MPRTAALVTPMPEPPRATRLRRLLPWAAGLVVVGAGTAAVGTVWVLRSSAPPAAVTSTSGVARFNFRVTGIPVPGTVAGVKADVAFRPNDLTHAVGRVRVDLSGLQTGIALRDEHAKNYLGVQTHPNAVFTLTRIEGAKALSAGRPVQAFALGTFGLGGVSVPLRAPVTLTLDDAGKEVSVQTHFDVTFAQHRIKIPGADPRTDVTVAFRLPVAAR